EIADDAGTWKRMTRTGVISAPPPIPVSPMTKPTPRPASAMSHCTRSTTFSTGDFSTEIVEKVYSEFGSCCSLYLSSGLFRYLLTSLLSAAQHYILWLRRWL